MRRLTTPGFIHALALSFWQLACLPVAASPIEHEVNTSSLLGPVAFAYGFHTLNSELKTPVELDGYIFNGAAGDNVRILVHTFSGGLDAPVTLRGPTGAIQKSVSCDGFVTGLCSVGLDKQISNTGSYTINIADLGSNESGGHQLHSDQYPPENNWVDVKYSTTAYEALGHSTDLDFFAFSGEAGIGVQLAAASGTGWLDCGWPVSDSWQCPPRGTAGRAGVHRHIEILSRRVNYAIY